MPICIEKPIQLNTGKQIFPWLNKVLVDATKGFSPLVQPTKNLICSKLRNLVVKNLIASNERVSLSILPRNTRFPQTTSKRKRIPNRVAGRHISYLSAYHYRWKHIWAINDCNPSATRVSSYALNYSSPWKGPYVSVERASNYAPRSTCVRAHRAFTSILPPWCRCRRRRTHAALLENIRVR